MVDVRAPVFSVAVVSAQATKLGYPRTDATVECRQQTTGTLAGTKVFLQGLLGRVPSRLVASLPVIRNPGGG